MLQRCDEVKVSHPSLTSSHSWVCSTSDQGARDSQAGAGGSSKLYNNNQVLVGLVQLYLVKVIGKVRRLSGRACTNRVQAQELTTLTVPRFCSCSDFNDGLAPSATYRYVVVAVMRVMNC
jgi:hypothetical protein